MILICSSPTKKRPFGNPLCVFFRTSVINGGSDFLLILTQVTVKMLPAGIVTKLICESFVAMCV